MALPAPQGVWKVQQGQTPTDAVTDAAWENMERTVGRILDQARRVTERGEPLPSCSQHKLPRLQCGRLKSARDIQLLLNTLFHFKPHTCLVGGCFGNRVPFTVTVSLFHLRD